MDKSGALYNNEAIQWLNQSKIAARSARSKR
jgi:hypothetical protein